jgi:branched-chain amino acid aminotransferase
VFEGQRAYGGVIFKLSEHSAALRKSAELLGFELPWSVEKSTPPATRWSRPMA